jgi:hypothetical protein
MALPRLVEMLGVPFWPFWRAKENPTWDNGAHNRPAQHTIVGGHDKQVPAAFLADVLGLGQPKPIGPLSTVAAGKGD